MRPRRLLVLLVALAVAASAGAATTKEIKPGDLRVCGAKRCIALMSPALSRQLGSFVYLGPQPGMTRSPAMGAPAFQLRFRNGYVAGIFASARLDRWLSYGVYIERFTRGKWYAVPPATASNLRKLAATLKPLRLTPAAVARSR